MKVKVLMGFLGFALLALISCNSNAAIDKSGKEYTSEYICPMHCKESGSDSPGKCPVCKMDYIKNDQHGHAEESHSHEGHDHSHEGHDHGDHSHHGHDHDGHDH